MANYLPFLTNFYYGTGTAGLIAAVGSFNFVEQGIVGLNSGDGPTPELTGDSRGPCDSTTTGFAAQDATSGAFDFRGVTDHTIFGWYRFDSLPTSQEVFAHWTTTGNEQGFVYRYEDSFGVMVVHAKGTTNNVDAGVGTTVSINTWNFGGVSVRAGQYYVHSNGATRGLGDLPILGAYAHTVNTPFRIGVTVSGVSGSGLKGDIAYVNNFNYGFEEKDWLYFWNNGRGRVYPRGYKTPPLVNPALLGVN